ncbi:hypothetical protein [Kitasatospora kazusensis]
MGITASASAIDITPDQSKLGQGTGPWYIDPAVQVTGWSVQSVQVQEYNPDTKYADQVANLGTGYCGYASWPDYCPDPSNGHERAYYRIQIPSQLYTQPTGAPARPTILSSTLAVQVTSASSPSTATTYGVYWTGTIDGDTTWHNQPCGNGMYGCNKVTNNSQALTGTGQISFDVTSAVQQIAGGNNDNWTIAVIPDNESDLYQRHHLANNPSITTTYDLQPSIWWPRTRTDTGQAPGFASNNSHEDCNSGTNPAWIGANQNISLNVSHWSPTGQQLQTTFKFWSDTGAPPIYQTSPYAGNQDVQVPVNSSSMPDGHTFAWYANTTDGSLTSNLTSACFLRVDKTPPNVSINSTDFPPSGSPAAPTTKYASDIGHFTVTAADPVPSGGSASGVACIRITTSSSPATGWTCGESQGDTYAGGHVDYSHIPGLWGTNLLYAQAMDNAGNYSQPAAYSYYAPWKPGTVPTFGDVDGDQKPDILLPDSSGNLRIVGGSADPVHAAAAVAASAPGNDQNNHFTWNDFRITHRGTLDSGLGVDQLIVHNTKDTAQKKFLYLVYNDGHGNFAQKPATLLTRPTQCVLTLGGTPGACPATYGPDWSDITQLVAIGTPEGEATATNVTDPTKHVTITQTSLLAVENGQLWLFRPSDGAYDQLSGTAQLIPFASTVAANTSWNNYDLIAPGPANGLTTPNQATIWARSRLDGTIHSYPIALDSQGNPDYTKLQDPASGYIPHTGSIDPVNFPLVGSSGDLNGDGIPDFWAVKNDPTNRTLYVWPGTADPATKAVNGFAAPANFGSVGTPVSSTLAPGGILHPGDTAYAAHTRLVMQTDGNLVLYSLNTGIALWSTRTNGHLGAWATMQSDGSLVVYTPKTDAGGNPVYPTPGSSSDALWTSGTAGSVGAHATVQADCNFVIYNTANTAIWNSGTYNPNP